MTATPTITISVWQDRLEKLNDLLDFYRRENRPISRTEVFWYGIDALHALKCPSQNTIVQSEGQSDDQQVAA